MNVGAKTGSHHKTEDRAVSIRFFSHITKYFRRTSENLIQSPPQLNDLSGESRGKELPERTGFRSP
jgi:hypothetical protein